MKEHEKRLQLITPDVEKMRNALAARNEQVAQLEARLERSRKESETQLLRTRQEAEEVDKLHSTCRGRISKLELQLEGLGSELEAARRIKREVRVEPVYIERPVEVDRVVEKIVAVEKVVNKYIEPTTFRDEQLEADLQRAREENAHLLNELHLWEEKFLSRGREYEEALRQYE